MLYRKLARSGCECVSVSCSFVTPINWLYLQVCIRFPLHILILFIRSLYIEQLSVHITRLYRDVLKIFAVALHFVQFLKHLSFDIILCFAFSCRTSPVQTFPSLLIIFVMFHCCTVHVISISSLLFQLMHFTTR
jgi:hypothetical protein